MAILIKYLFMHVCVYECTLVCGGQKRPSGVLCQVTYSLEAGSLPGGGTPTFSSRQEASKFHLPTSACLLQVSCFCECWDSTSHSQGYRANTLLTVEPSLNSLIVFLPAKGHIIQSVPQNHAFLMK